MDKNFILNTPQANQEEIQKLLISNDIANSIEKSRLNNPDF